MSKIDIQFPIHRGPTQINWMPMTAVPKDGKILILNFNRKTGSLFVSTAYMNADMPMQTRADYLKWAMAWAHFPDIVYTVIEDEKDLA